jgi:hypothetical protein
MTVRYVEYHKCDRCKKDFDPKSGGWNEPTTDNLKWMFKERGSGSADSDMRKELCKPCTRQFLDFMAGRAVEETEE